MRPPFLLPICAWLAAAMFAAAEAPAPRNDAAAEKLGWRLATKAYTFRTRTLEETLEITRSLGLKYYEVNPTQKLSQEHPVNTDQKLSPELRAEMKKRFAAAGVKPMAFGVVKLGADEAADREIFAFAKELGITTLVAEPPPEAFDILEKLTAEYGINVALHNHPQPSRYWNPETVLEAIKGRGPHFGACADTGHWTRSGLNAPACLKQLEGRVLTLHFKDADAQKKDVPWGTGQTDVRGMLEELHREHFHGLFSMEYESGAGDKLVEELAQSIATFDRIAAELAK